MIAVCRSRGTRKSAICFGCLATFLSILAYGCRHIFLYDGNDGLVARQALQPSIKHDFGPGGSKLKNVALKKVLPSSVGRENSTVRDPVFKQALSGTFKTDAKCSPHRKVVFVKTHKTASSSVQRIIVEHLKRTRSRKPARFPPIYLGGYPGRFDARFVVDVSGNSMSVPGRGPDAIADHIRFNKTSLEDFMPAGTSYITILRTPMAAFQSSFHYYYGQVKSRQNFDKMGVTCFYSPFVDILGKLNASFSDYLKIAPARLNPNVPWYFRSLNYQAHDLGLDPMRSDTEYVKNQIRILDSTFNLVMIADYFLESLVLLREELCMDWSILSSAIINDGNYKKYELSMQEQSTVRRLTKLDSALYHHFNRSLWRKINAYGRERMARDIERIKRPPTAVQSEFLKHQTRKEHTEAEDADFGDEDISHSYKANALARLVSRIPRGTHIHVEKEKIEALAEYMIKNSGGCNF